MPQRSDTGSDEKNWPPFCPLIHHDIKNDIPPHLHRMQYLAFATYLGLIVCLTWNVVATMTAWLHGEGMQIWLLSVFYLLFGVPGAYILWYRSLYHAFRSDESTIQFGCFFFLYAIHICFCIWAAVALPFVCQGKSFTGILAALTMFGSPLAGLFYVIGFILYCSESFLSIFVFQQVFMYHRGVGTAAEMKKIAAQEAARAAQ